MAYKCPDCGENLLLVSPPNPSSVKLEYGCKNFSKCPASKHRVRFTESQLTNAYATRTATATLQQQAQAARKANPYFQHQSWVSNSTKQYNPYPWAQQQQVPTTVSSPQYCPKCKKMAGVTFELTPNRFGDWYCGNCFSVFTDTELQGLLNSAMRNEMKEVIVNTTANGTIYELKFKTLQRKGYFTDNIQPVINVIKAMIPAVAREYNPSTYTWGLGAEYWPALKTTLEALNFKITMVDTQAASSGPKVYVPKDYEENFYHAPAAPEKETAKSIAEQLSKYLGVTITTQELSELKKLYRAKARELHPDMGGDAAAMSELNRLWTLYTNTGVTQ